jgi:hypothetical protein
MKSETNETLSTRLLGARGQSVDLHAWQIDGSFSGGLFAIDEIAKSPALQDFQVDAE